MSLINRIKCWIGWHKYDFLFPVEKRFSISQAICTEVDYPCSRLECSKYMSEVKRNEVLNIRLDNLKWIVDNLTNGFITIEGKPEYRDFNYGDILRTALSPLHPPLSCPHDSVTDNVCDDCKEVLDT